VGTSLSDALGRVTLFSERSERSRLPATEAQCSPYSAGARGASRTTFCKSLTASNSESLNLFQAETTFECAILAGLLLEVRMAPAFLTDPPAGAHPVPEFSGRLLLP